MSEVQNGRCGYCAIVGRPNVGKSTLLNRLIGQKLAITSHKPQTTRHSILGVKTIDEGQIIYVDTPGIHKRGDHAMNRYLNRTARSALADVDMILFVVEALRWTDEDQAVLETISRLDIPVLLLVNKIDTVKNKEELLPFLEEAAGRFTFSAVIPLSARKGDNIPPLEKQVLSGMPENRPFFPEDQLTDRSERFFAAELIREQLTQRYAKEIPLCVNR